MHGLHAVDSFVVEGENYTSVAYIYNTHMTTPRAFMRTDISITVTAPKRPLCSHTAPPHTSPKPCVIMRENALFFCSVHIIIYALVGN